MYRPKVGEMVICHIKDVGKWYSKFDGREVEIIGYNKTKDGEEVVTFCDNKNYGLCALCFDGTEFIPIKSKRDEEIEEMKTTISENQDKLREISGCEILHNKGYRKQLPYSQFVSIIQCYLITLGYPDSKVLSYSQELANLLGRVEDTL